MRVLLVEDEVLVAMDLSHTIESMGHEVVGPAYRLASGLDAATHEALDFAILDLNLGGELSFAIAQVLRDRGIPHLFLTGYRLDHLPAEYRDSPVIHKPLTRSELERAFDAIDGREASQ